MFRHLTTDTYRVVPWANGRGQTTEMLRTEGAGGIVWRLSMAQVTEDGPFSVLPGLQRNLTVIAGPGFDLIGPGVRLRADPLVPVAFSGDLALEASGVTGPSVDFNVMVAARLPAPDVAVIDGVTDLAAGGLLLILALGQVQAGEAAMGRTDLVMTDQPLRVAGQAISVLIRR